MTASNKLIKPEIPAGFLDFLPPEFLARESMIKTINSVFRSYGYDPIETPMAEFVDVLTGEDETSKNIFVLRDSQRRNEEKLLALRFDQTVPLARYISLHPYDPQTKTGIRLPWRRMVIGPVFRADSPQKGRFRQFYQADVDIVGVKDMIADSEIISVINDIFVALGIERFIIKLNNRKILNGVADLIELEARPEAPIEDMLRSVFRILDKLDKIGLGRVIQELKQPPADIYDPSPNLNDEQVNKIISFILIEGGNLDKLKEAKGIFAGVGIAEEGIKELEEILSLTSHIPDIDEKLKVDFTVARGLDYYSGPVMETSLLDAQEYGSVFSGGRYDDLVARFTGNSLPAVGASIGVDRLFAALKHLDVISSKKQSSAEVVILDIDQSLRFKYLEIASLARKFGYNAEICLSEDKTFKGQFNFALARSPVFIVIFGQEEDEKGLVKVKDVSSREQTEIPLSELRKFFQKQAVIELSNKMTEGVRHES